LKYYLNQTLTADGFIFVEIRTERPGVVRGWKFLGVDQRVLEAAEDEPTLIDDGNAASSIGDHTQIGNLKEIILFGYSYSATIITTDNETF
jgi:hypothetical protein